MYIKQNYTYNYTIMQFFIIFMSLYCYKLQLNSYYQNQNSIPVTIKIKKTYYVM